MSEKKRLTDSGIEIKTVYTPESVTHQPTERPGDNREPLGKTTAM